MCIFLCSRKLLEGGNGAADMNLNKVHFSTEKDDISLYGTPKEEIIPLSTSRYRQKRLDENKHQR
jgi:hypothetical protein